MCAVKKGQPPSLQAPSSPEAAHKARGKLAGLFLYFLDQSRPASEVKLELIQSHMTQKPMLRGEVGACGWRELFQTKESVLDRHWAWVRSDVPSLPWLEH